MTKFKTFYRFFFVKNIVAFAFLAQKNMEVYSKLHGFLSKKQQEQAVINPPINSELRRLYRGPQANQAVRSK